MQRKVWFCFGAFCHYLGFTCGVFGKPTGGMDWPGRNSMGFDGLIFAGLCGSALPRRRAGWCPSGLADSTWYPAPSTPTFEAMNALAVALGGALGSLLRWSFSLLLRRVDAPLFTASAATLLANIAAAATLGYLMARPNPDARLQLALVTGFCGGFSTMSTFSWEALEWAKSGSWLAAFAYIAATLVLSFGAAAAAYALANK